MTLIIKNRAVTEDAWQVLRAAEDGSLPDAKALPAGPVIVPLSLWQAEREALLAAKPQAELGVWLASDSEPTDVAGDLAHFALVAVDFPKFGDGRGYSIATLLRTRHGWTGELRAIGDVLRDQLLYMSRCGFDAFAVRADRDIHDALNAFKEFTQFYQASVSNPEPLFLRMQAADAKVSA